VSEIADNELNTIESFTCTPSLAKNTTNSSAAAIFDSGTTGHYIMLDTACINKQPATKPIVFILPNRQRITSTHEAKLPFLDLPDKAVQAYVFPGLNGHALLSIGTFCDAGCTATFLATTINIEKHGKIILMGTQELPGLWKTTKDMLETAATTLAQANSAFTSNVMTNVIQFLHTACFSPTTVTWTQAIDRSHFKSWLVPPPTRYKNS
jgi:hypothetical protein